MDTGSFEEALLKEKRELEKSLAVSSAKNPQNPSDWSAKYPDLNVSSSDKSDMADEVEEFDNALGINAVLDQKLQEINAALERIKKGAYGKCEVGGEMIEEDRLRANPAARSCIKHSG